MREYIAAARRFGGAAMGELLGPQPTGPDTEAWSADEAGDYCPRCGASVDETGQTPRGCPFCVGQHLAWHRLVRLRAYAEPMQGWIVSSKFGGQWRWATALGRRLGERVAPLATEQRSVVCAVPMHWARRWRRGYNQAELMARAMADVLGAPTVPLLHRTRYTRPQTVVAPSQRRQNVRDSVAAAAVDLSGWTVWLVDDVKTSGATLTQCARLLREAGAVMVNVAVLAVADPKGGDFTRI